VKEIGKLKYYKKYMEKFLANILKHVKKSRKDPIDIVVNKLYCILGFITVMGPIKFVSYP
jgi:hypothetical protein